MKNEPLNHIVKAYNEIITIAEKYLRPNRTNNDSDTSKPEDLVSLSFDNAHSPIRCKEDYDEELSPKVLKWAGLKNCGPSVRINEEFT